MTDNNIYKKILEKLGTGVVSFKAIRNAAGNIVDFEGIFFNDAAQAFVKTHEFRIGQCLKEVFPKLFHQHLDSLIDVVENNHNFHIYADLIYKVSKMEDGFTLTIIDPNENESPDLSQNHHEFESIANFSPFIVFRLDSKGYPEFINRPWNEPNNYRRKTLNIISDFVHPEDLPLAIRKWKDANILKNPFEVEIRIKDREDEYLWHLTHVYPKKDLSGEIVNWYGCSIDFNQYKTVLQKLHERAEEFEFMVNSVPHIVWRANPKGEVEFYNKRWIDYTGIDSNEGAKGKWRGVPHPDDTQATLDAWMNSVSAGQEYKIEHRIIGNDGNYRWMRSHALPLFDNKKKIKMWYGTATDIHEERILREAVEKQAKEFSIITEVIPQLIWTAQSDGSFTFFNHQWLEYTGLEYELLKKKGWMEAIHPDDQKSAIANWKKSLSSGIIFNEEHRLRNKSGNYQWFLVRAYPLKNETGEVLRWFGTYTNIHDQKTLEINKGEFLNIASHELRTPLTALSAYLQLMGQSKVGTINEFMPKLNKAVERLKKLVVLLLDVSRIDLDKDLIMNFEEFQLDELLREVVDENNLMSSNRIELEAPPRIKINGDVIRIQQVLNNVISNALKFSPDGEMVKIHLKDNSKDAEIVVVDKGMGITEQEKAHIFDRFYTSGHLISGLGLGLFISKKIMEYHNGNIYMEDNQVHDGVTFIIQLPKA